MDPVYVESKLSPALGHDGALALGIRACRWPGVAAKDASYDSRRKAVHLGALSASKARARDIRRTSTDSPGWLDRGSGTSFLLRVPPPTVVAQPPSAIEDLKREADTEDHQAHVAVRQQGRQNASSTCARDIEALRGPSSKSMPRRSAACQRDQVSTTSPGVMRTNVSQKD